MSYDMHAVLRAIVDDGELDEFQADLAREMICGDARIDGIPVGVIANQRGLIKGRAGEKPRFGGIVYAESAEKVAYFIDRCDRQGIPLLFVQDVSGFMVGPEAEHEGIIRAGARFVEAMATARVPKIVLTVNHASGAGYYAMAGQGFDPDFIFSWPTGRMGVMEGESAVQAVHGPALDEGEEGRKRRWPPKYASRDGRDARRLRAPARRALRRRARLRRRDRLPRRNARRAGDGAARVAAEPGPAPRCRSSCRRTSRRACARERQLVRVASGQGFWGDWLEAPRRQVEGGPIDYLMLDYLAEVTMSILQKQKERDPTMGYARDFVGAMESVLPAVVERGVQRDRERGRREPACVRRRRCARSPTKRGARGKVTIGVVTGDDLLAAPRRADRERPRARATWTPASRCRSMRDRVLSANAYIGSDADRRGARAAARNVVITGRSTDTALTMAPLRHEFGWGADDWDQLAAGIVAGHIIECGAQCSGGNCLYDWRIDPRPGERRLSDRRRRRPTARSSSRSIRTPAAASPFRLSPSSSCTRWAIRTRTSRPTSSPTSRRIQLEQAGRRIACACSGSRARPRPTSSRSRSPTAPGSRRSARWCTRGLMRSRRRSSPTACFASGSTGSASSSTRCSPSSSARRATHGRCAGGVQRDAARSAAARRRARRRSQGGGAIHARDRAARAERSAERDRICRRPPEGRGDRRLLAGARSTRPSCTTHVEVRLMKVRLVDIAHARSGDKGDTANVGVIALEAASGTSCSSKLVTRERVAEHFAAMIDGDVERFELPNLNALNFLLHGALDGGGTLSLKTDAQGKVFSTALLRMIIDVPDDEASRLGLKEFK